MNSFKELPPLIIRRIVRNMEKQMLPLHQVASVNDLTWGHWWCRPSGPSERRTRLHAVARCRVMRLQNSGMGKNKRKRNPKTVLKVPDLEQSKSAVLTSLTSLSSQRSYDHGIREFIDWYCLEPRLAFNKTVVTRYRIASNRRTTHLPP